MPKFLSVFFAAFLQPLKVLIEIILIIKNWLLIVFMNRPVRTPEVDQHAVWCGDGELTTPLHPISRLPLLTEQFHLLFFHRFPHFDGKVCHREWFLNKFYILVHDSSVSDHISRISGHE